MRPPLLCGRQESASNECFRPRIVWFFLYLLVLFYIAIGNMGTILASKQSKSIDFCKCPNGQKICIYNGFHSSRLFNSKDLYIIFYCTAHIAEQARRVIQRVFCFLPQSMTRPEMVWPRRQRCLRKNGRLRHRLT